MSDEKCAWCNDDPRERLNGLCACNTRDVMEENARLRKALEFCKSNAEDVEPFSVACKRIVQAATEALEKK